MVWHQTIDRGEVRIVEAHIHAAFVSMEGRPTRIPDDLRRALGTLT